MEGINGGLEYTSRQFQPSAYWCYMSCMVDEMCDRASYRDMECYKYRNLDFLLTVDMHSSTAFKACPWGKHHCLTHYQKTNCRLIKTESF